ncbi:hypothetical protein HYFRA_00004626 [Hymenoscyphus fraxineus]|uniref:Extracellular metalloproteinase n=1 Tax=Hymenoscyphus fraxineus TaxID=746836 RepID=A0A9N9KY41_9HELO|nr:hypothetical protein HYFRA_00004626 [Hymenoscyphus fraxineus]
MRFTSAQTAAVALLSTPVLGHPHPATSNKSPKEVQRRDVDLTAFRLGVGSQYATSLNLTESTPELSIVEPTYTETATALVKKVAPNAEFRLASNYESGNGIGHVVFKQTLHGIDIDTADFNVNVKDGQVFSFGNSFYTGALPTENPLVKRDQVDPVTALQAACSTLQIPVVADAAQAVPEEETEHYVITGSSGALSDPKAKLIYVQDGESLALSWRLETDIGDNWLLSFVDAKAPEKVFHVVDYVAEATYNVYPWGVIDPSKGSRVIETDPWDTRSSEFTWQGTGSTTFNTTRGNNGNAQVNYEGDTAWINDYRPVQASANFDYPYSTSTVDPRSYADASVTQIFYTSNVYHDLLYVMGFNEAAGNFEVNNNGQGGAGNDAVTLNSQDGSGTNNANFATPADGQVPRMRMYLWDAATPVRDSSFDAGVVIHEYTHGLSNRLTGGPANSGCLSTTEAGGMGEGWSDFMAVAIHVKTTDTRATNTPMGDWVYNNPAGIRRYVYSTSMTTNPLVYSTANGSTLVHFIGTIWATMLYELMWNLIEAHGINSDRQPTYVNGVPNDGRFLAMQLVVDGMKLQPCRPNFLSARDAILDADVALTGGANACSIWKAFAKRGLGANASRSSNANDNNSRVNSFDLPEGLSC